MSLEAVAAAAAMSPSTLSRLENGKRRLAVDHLAPLAARSETSVDALLAPQRGPTRACGDGREVEGHPAWCRSAGGGGGARTRTT